MVQLAAADCHSLALTSNGHMFAWGDNRHGQLGLAAEMADNRLGHLGLAAEVAELPAVSKGERDGGAGGAGRDAPAAADIRVTDRCRGGVGGGRWRGWEAIV